MASNPSAHRTIPTSEQGLTLIEMIVVLAIISIIAGLIVVNVINRPDQARGTTTQVDMRNIASALKIYRLDNGDYPSTAQGLAALVAKPTGEPVARNWNSGGYLDAVPIDPWGHPYIYRSPGEGGTGFDLVSTGKDGKPGGEGLDADVKVSGR